MMFAQVSLSPSLTCLELHEQSQEPLVRLTQVWATQRRFLVRVLILEIGGLNLLHVVAKTDPLASIK